MSASEAGFAAREAGFAAREAGRQRQLAPARRLPAARRAVLAALDRGPAPQVVSTVTWSNEPGWSLAPRTVVDDFLLLPLAGRLEALVAERRWPLAPGQVLLLPAGRVHALRNAGPGPCRHLVVHALLADRDRRSWWAHFRDPVLPLPSGDAASWWWRCTLADTADTQALRPAQAALALRLLAVELVLTGAALAPQPALDPRVSAVLAHIDRDYASDHGIPDYAAAVGLSAVHLRSLFQRHLGRSPKAVLTERRLHQAALLLRSSHRQVRHIAAAVGYLSDHYFHRCFKQAYGVTPSDYRRGLGPV